MSHFLDLYRARKDFTEVPWRWHEWAAISLTAACLRNKVHVALGDDQVYPNLYVLLTGPSGSGKESVCSSILQLVQKIPVINGGAMKFTSAHLSDVLSGGVTLAANGEQVKAELFDPHCLYIVTEEMAHSFPSAGHCHEACKMLVQQYKGVKAPMYEGTRTSGVNVIPQACINWLAGSNAEFAREVADRKQARTGFWARIMVVMGNRDPNKRIAFPQKPPNAEAMSEMIVQRCLHWAKLDGVVTLTEEAVRECTVWYETLPAPPRGEEDRGPMFLRRQETMLKLALIESVQRYDPLEGEAYDYRIDVDCLRVGMARYEEVERQMMRFFEQLSETQESEVGQWVESYLRERSCVPIRRFNDQARRKGYQLYEIRQVVQALIQEGVIKVTKAEEKGTGRQLPGNWYSWEGNA